MVSNRSVPTNVILPHVSYRNVAEAMAWLSRVFGFREHYRYGVDGDRVSGAQMHLGEAYVMLRTRAGATPAELGFGTQSLTVFVEDVDGHYAKAKAEGATIVEELHETEYGERQYGVVDLDGHHWLFSRHARDVRPQEWGAVVAAK
ncbi:MAG: VOC family protein [Acidobacteriota bacterium]|nr:VOC family protein [Acidobacteriota bacterium]